MKRPFLPAMCAVLLAACAADVDVLLEDPPTDPPSDAPLVEHPDVITNPLAPIVGYEQINLTEAWGSCGSHSGAVAIARIEHDGTVADVEAIENALYYTYGGRVYGGPGAATLAGVFDRYLNAHGIPYHAVVFHTHTEVLGYLQAGSPVVTNTTQWAGHYVTIYGLTGGNVYFSDGTQSDGISSATLPRGNLKVWPWATFLQYVKGNYIALVHN